MYVKLRVKPGCVINGKSRNFHYHALSDEVNNTIRNWYETGVIMDAPSRNPYNNSLTVSTKLLPDGSQNVPDVINETAGHNQKSFSNQMLAEWKDTFLWFKINIVYRLGILNIIPDTLSRAFPEGILKDDHHKSMILNDTEYLVPPPEKREELLTEVYSFGHYGHHAMIQELNEHGIKWNNMQKDCWEYAKSCNTCQRVNIAKRDITLCELVMQPCLVSV
ncbi:hypothetical protein K457DRAFT_131299 [Linnemannia elongata AG-77]|uniref:Integrase zinc-binding domain-containing protein n=1 Tax=Linnemannia elongata AG-77 TaxID=1314771 RepID=A0A197JD35_9FUNG|nr:hypothetical protein K457DRAFT_131299 [Linnemannia elongata AG-77]